MKVSKTPTLPDESTVQWADIDSELKGLIADAFRRAYNRRTTRHTYKAFDMVNPKIVIAKDKTVCRIDRSHENIIELLLQPIS